MRELIYTLLELERESRKVCDLCPKLYGGDNSRSVNQIRTHIKATEKWVSDDSVCQKCKEKFLNDELPKCERCGRLRHRHDIDVLSGKHICRCVRRKENLEEKELPSLPSYESQAVSYERQINGLQEELNTAEVEIDTYLEALEISEDWHKRQKQELLDRIKELEAEVERLKKQTPQELVDKLSAKEKEVSELKNQLEQQNAQV